MSNTEMVIDSLGRAECEALLARNHVGRLAYSFHDRVDIEPLHYAYDANFIYGRTSLGAKLATLAHNHWIAFEVDEIRDFFDWSSVVVHGSFQRLDPGGTKLEAAGAARAVELLRAIVPGTLAPDDPAPSRTVLFRIAVDEVTGRMALPPR